MILQCAGCGGIMGTRPPYELKAIEYAICEACANRGKPDRSEEQQEERARLEEFRNAK